MKKFVFLLLFLLFGFTLANDSSIGDVYVDFCNTDNNTKSLSMLLESGREGEICIEFSNFSEQDLQISYGFVDGVVTADQFKSKACKNEGDIEKFGQYVRQDNKLVTIPSLTKVTQKAYIKFPAGFTGMVNGCLTYFVSNTKDTLNIESSMFDVLVRKASFIDVLVGGELSRNLKLDQDKAINTTYSKKDKILILELAFDNAGNVNESVVAAGSISNIFGYNASFSGENIKISSESKAVLKVEIDTIPWYKMFFNISLDITSNPNFDFNPESLPENIKEPIKINAETKIFIFPRIILYILLGLIVLIILFNYLSKHLKIK